MKAPLKPIGQGRWSILVDVGRDSAGKRQRRRFTIHAASKREAEQERIRILNELQQGALAGPQSLSFGEYLDWWLENCVRPRVSERTFEGYRSIIDGHLKPELGRIRLSKLSSMQLQTYESGALQSGRADGKGGLSQRTVLHHHRVMHSALKQAVRSGLILRNPLDAVEPPKPQRHEVTTLNAEGVGRLLTAAVGTRLYVPVFLAVCTGMRRGELLGLHWEDLDLNTGRLAVRYSLQTIQGANEPILKAPKSGRTHTVSLPASAIAVLRQHKEEQAALKTLFGKDYVENDLVFPEEDGRPWKPNAFTGRWDRFKRAHGFDIRFHDLRHTAASLLLDVDAHPKVVQERLGHSTIAITMDLYSHLLPNLQEEAAARLDGLLSPYLPASKGDAL